MAANAYILVNADPTHTEEVFKRLEAINSAVVHEVLGAYDFVVVLEAAPQGDITTSPRHRAVR